MNDFIHECVQVLIATPIVLNVWLGQLPEELTAATEGPGTWSPYDVVGHLVHGEKTDWIPRLEIILEHGIGRPFDRFDREAQFRESNGKSLRELLDEFSELRHRNVLRLPTTPAVLDREGMHPDLGRVTVRQLLSTWMAHDLSHMTQISRTMARHYRDEVGPWAQYLSVMK